MKRGLASPRVHSALPITRRRRDQLAVFRMMGGRANATLATPLSSCADDDSLCARVAFAGRSGRSHDVQGACPVGAVSAEQYLRGLAHRCASLDANPQIQRGGSNRSSRSLWTWRSRRARIAFGALLSDRSRHTPWPLRPRRSRSASVPLWSLRPRWASASGITFWALQAGQPSRSGISLQALWPLWTWGSRSPDDARVTLRSLWPANSAIALRPTRSRRPWITFCSLRSRGSGVALRSLQPRRPHCSRLSLLAVRTDYANRTSFAGGTLRPDGAGVTCIAFRARRARRSCVASGTSKSLRSSGSGIPFRSQRPHRSHRSNLAHGARRSSDPRRPCSSGLPSITLLSLCARGQR